MESLESRTMLDGAALPPKTELTLTPSATEIQYRDLPPFWDGRPETALMSLSVHLTSGGEPISGAVNITDEDNNIASPYWLYADQGDGQTFIGGLSVGLHHFTAIFTDATATAQVLVTKATPQVQVNATSATPWTLEAVIGTPADYLQGKVTFSEGSRILGSADVWQGKATLRVSRWTAGSHVITAHYGGDDHFRETDGQTTLEIAPETTKLLLQNWFAATPTHSPTFTVRVQNARGWTLGNWAAPFDWGQARFASATVSIHVRQPAPVLLNTGGSSGGGESGSGSINTGCDQCLTPPPVPQGTVRFMEGDTLLGEVPMNVDGIATFRPGKLTLGPHEIVASWEGDQYYAPSSSEVIHYVVTKTQTNTIVLASSNRVRQGGSVTLMGKVGTEPDAVTPRGWMVLKDGKHTLARLKLDTKLKVLDLDLPVGMHLITAIYEGDKNCLASRSVAFKLRVTPG